MSLKGHYQRIEDIGYIKSCYMTYGKYFNMVNNYIETYIKLQKWQF